MSAVKNCASDKLHVIDRKTFECIQLHRNTINDDPYHKIRNAKFRKKNAALGGRGTAINLMHFLTKTPKQSQKAKKLGSRRGCILGIRNDKTSKKRGKMREGDKRKSRSRLKKAILGYRLQKKWTQSNLEDSTKLLKETAEQISRLTIASKEDEKQENINSIHKQESLKVFHSRRFRSYCDNCTTPLLAELTEQLLRELDRFQKRAVCQNSIKAHAHRRFVVGFREAQSFLLVNKVKLIIIAPDCEVCDGEDGLDAKIDKIKNQCKQQTTPYLFALRRRQLAYALFKKAPVSCVAILDFDGAREIFSKLLEARQKARQSYEELIMSQPSMPSLKIDENNLLCPTSVTIIK